MMLMIWVIKSFVAATFLQPAALAANYKTKWNFNKCVFQTARRRLWERNTKHHQNKHHNFQTKVFRPRGRYLAVLWLHLALVALCYFEFLQDLASEVWNWLYFIVLWTMETEKNIPINILNDGYKEVNSLLQLKIMGLLLETICL